MHKQIATDTSLLQAALIGYHSQLDEITAKMAEIRKELGGKTAKASAAATPSAPRKKRKMSAAGRKAISESTKKRWAEYHKNKTA
jgi:hypothetical protein